MSNFPIRFGQGQGLEGALNAQTQPGLLELNNVSLELREVVQKRPGSEQVALTIGADPDDVLDSEGLQSVAYRQDELCVWSDRSLYSRNKAVAEADVDVPVGVATDQQIDAAKSNAVAALAVQSQSFSLAGHPDAASVVADFSPARPNNQTATSPIGSLGGVRIVGGAVVFTTSVASAFGPRTGDLTLDSGGATDVRIVYQSEVVAGGFAEVTRWRVAWRIGSTVKWTTVRVDLAQGGGGTGGGASLSLSDAGPIEQFAVNGRPYDMIRQDTVTNGDEPTLLYFASSNTLTARTYDSNVGNFFSRTVGLPFSVTGDDLILGVAEDLGGVQSAALFRRPLGGQHRYSPLSINTAFTLTTIRIPSQLATERPNVIRSTDTTRQVVGLRDQGTGGQHVFTAIPGSSPQWVATRGNTTDGLSSTHTVSVTEESTGTWTIRRGANNCLVVSQAAARRLFLRTFAGVIVGVKTVEGSLQRMAYTPATDGPFPDYDTLGGSGQGHLALATSANRIAYIYRPTNTTLRVASSANGVAWNEGPSETFGDAIFEDALHGALIITAATGTNEVTGTWYFRIGSAVLRRTVSTADPVQGTTLSTRAPDGPIYAEDIGVIDLVVVGQPGSQTTYEFGSNYVVQVDPRLLSQTAGNFGRRGPWTASRMRQEVPLQAVGGGVIVASDMGEIDGVRVALWQVSGGTAPGVYYGVYSDHLELAEGAVRIDSSGTRPKVVVNHGDGSALLIYLDAATLIKVARWTPSALAPVFANLGGGGGFVAFGNAYETLAVSTDIASVTQHKYVVVNVRSAAEVRVTRILASDLSPIQASETFGVPSSASVIAATIERANDDDFTIRGCVPGAAGISTFRINCPDGGASTLVTNNANSYTFNPAQVRRLAIVSVDGTALYHLLVEHTSLYTELASNAGTEAAAFRRRYFRHSIWSSGMRLDSQRTYAVLGGAAGIIDCCGYWVVDLDTTEVVGRSFVSEGEIVASSRLTTCHLAHPALAGTADLTRLSHVGAAQARGSTAVTGTSDLSVLGFATLSFDARPFVTAELDGVVVHAHGGYPRMYAGEIPHEHDWHATPTILSATLVGGGSTSAGNYTVAASYEHTDPNGNTYRSRLTFLGPLSVTAGQQIQLQIVPLSMTERRNVQIVVWRTQANGSVYYRDLTFANDPNSAVAFTVNVGSASDAVLGSREILDTSRAIRTPCPSTDFVAVAGGRFFTRDPERGSLARFSTPRSEGFAPSWNFAFGLEVPSQRDITAVCDLDGRVILATNFDLSVAQGAGPGVDGSGAFQGPDRIPSETGCIGQPQTAEIPQGMVFGSASGPRLLDRGLNTEDLGSPVYRFFEDEGYLVRRCLYQPQQATLLIASSDGVNSLDLRWHVDNQRWARDTGRSVLAAAISRSGEIAYLCEDGRLLIEGDDAAKVRYQNLLAMRGLLGGEYPQHYWPGTLVDEVAGATLAQEGGAFISNDTGTLGVFNRTSFEVTGADLQDFAASDATVADLGAQASLAILWSQTLDALPGVSGVRSIMGKQSSAAGPNQNTGWILDQLGSGIGGGVRLSVDSNESAATTIALTSASSVVGQRRWFCAVIDCSAGEIRLGSDLQNATSVAFDPGLTYTTTAPFRIGDARFEDIAQLPIDGKVHSVTLIRGERATAIADCRALALAAKALDDTAEGVDPLAILPDRTDGEFGFPTSVGTPWIREPSADGTTHPGFVFEGATIFGTYLGSHSLRCEVYYDFSATPELVTEIPRTVIDGHAEAAEPYIYRVETARQCFAVRVRFSDTGEPNPTFRSEGIDIHWHGDKSLKVKQLPKTHLFVPVVTT